MTREAATPLNTAFGLLSSINGAAPGMQPSRNPTRNSFYGCLAASALGDAIGELAFRLPDESRLRDYIQNADELRYTDDTAMALGLAESIIACDGTVDAQHLGETFRKNYDREPWRGYGPGPPSIFRQVAQSEIGYLEAAQSLFGGEGSMGNGAAMRIAPAGVFFAGSDERYEMAALSARVTHAHRLGQDGAAVLAAAISLAATTDPNENFPAGDFATRLSGIARTDEFATAMERVQKLLQENAVRDQAAARLGTDVLIHRSVPYAIFSFLRNSKSFVDALMDAIMVEGDRDTIGAMTGAVSGAHLGIDAIPHEWLEKLENRQYIEELAAELVVHAT